MKNHNQVTLLNANTEFPEQSLATRDLVSRLAQQAEIAEGTGADFAASLNLEFADSKFQTILEKSESHSQQARAVGDLYGELASHWGPEDSDDDPGQLTSINDATVLEIVGQIKWFDVSKGYGFIVPDNGVSDVLLTVTCLRSGGFQSAYEGARIHCQVLRRPKGLQAFRILSMDDSTGIHPSLLPQRSHVLVEPESGWERAMVKWFNRVRGFGFLTRGEGTPDLFCHMETLRRSGFSQLRPGESVEIKYGHSSKGPTVAEMRPDALNTQRQSDAV